MDSQVAVKAVIQNKDGKFLIVREGERWQAVGGRLDREKNLKMAFVGKRKKKLGLLTLRLVR